MKKFKSEELLAQLENDVRQTILAVDHLKGADPVKLSYTSKDGAWSVVQVLEHLNILCRNYLPLIEKSIVHITRDTNAWFVSGFWGDYLTRKMMPKDVFEVKNKMKTFKALVPEKSLNVEGVFQEFVTHQNKLLQLLEVAKRRNLNTIHIPIMLTRAIRLKLGDMFRFLVAHQQRHMIQARNAVKALGISTDKFPVILEAAKQ